MKGKIESLWAPIALNARSLCVAPPSGTQIEIASRGTLQRYDECRAEVEVFNKVAGS